MRGIHSEEPAPIRAHELDPLLRRHRPLRNRLPHPLNGCRVSVRVEVHGHALPDQENAADQGEGQQHPKHRPHEIDPEVPQMIGALRSEPANEGDADRQS